MNYTKMPIGVETASAVREEFLEAYNAPNYDEDPQWYEEFCLSQDSMAIIPMELRPSAVPTISGILERLRLSHGLEFSHYQMFVCRPNHTSLFHIDGVYRKSSLNFPIFNCGVGGVEWTNEDPKSAYLFKDEFTNNFRAEEEDLPVVDSLILDCPHILRVHRWHRVNNKNNPKHRVVFGVRFNGNPSFDKVVSAFADISRDQLI